MKNRQKVFTMLGFPVTLKSEPTPTITRAKTGKTKSKKPVKKAVKNEREQKL